MNWFRSVAKTFGPRVIGAAVAGAASWIYTKTMGTVSVDAAEATKHVLELLVYAGTHRGVSALVNPGDAAKGRVADAVKDASDAVTDTAVTVRPASPEAIVVRGRTYILQKL